MKRLMAALLVCAFALAGTSAMAHDKHYTNGIEGLKAASLPPEGMYWRVYNIFYTADKMKTNKRKRAPGDFDLNVFGFVNRFIYSTPIEVLGGNLVVDAVVPLLYTDISYRDIGPASFSDNKFSLGDILVEPALISWHGERWDAVAGLGVWMPTGEYNGKRPADPGKGFWTLMLTGGGTLYFDDAKTWHASLLSRYEIHTEQKHTNITPGHDFHFEWGVGKTIGLVDVGVVGYCQWQVTKDTGHGSSDDLEEAYAIGPEIGFNIPPWGVNVTLRSLWEFENKNSTEGNITSLVITKAF